MASKSTHNKNLNRMRNAAAIAGMLAMVQDESAAGLERREVRFVRVATHPTLGISAAEYGAPDTPRTLESGDLLLDSPGGNTILL